MKRTAVFARVLIISGLLMPATGYCGDPYKAELLFEQGNASYTEERFGEAVTSYEEALATGYESGALYYNLGNAYFKKGMLGKAITNYMRAERIMPQDADVKSNLAYARSRIKSGAVMPQWDLLERLLYGSAGKFSPNGITVTVALLYLLVCMVAVAAILSKTHRRLLVNALIPFLAVLAVSSVLLTVKYRDVAMNRHAVVIADSADSRFEPFADATTFFTLNEGEDVVILMSKNGWAKVKRPDGRQGWVKAEELEFL